jgi:glycosyltransferase involved in cell wall biosynthesis
MNLCSAGRMPKPILFLARSLEGGGAERQLVNLALGLARRGQRVAVAVFYDGGPFAAELAAAGVQLFVVDKKGRWDVLPFLTRLLRLLRAQRPMVLHSYLAGPNIIAVVLKPLLLGARVVWGVRASNVDLQRYDWLTRAAYRIERRLARYADLIICNSRAGLEYAAAHGFPRKKMTVIANGICTDSFKADALARTTVRTGWGVSDSEVLIGLAARLDPMKDHPTFFRAAKMLSQLKKDLRFVCIGDGPEPYKTELRRLAGSLGLDRELIWAGARRDMSAVYSALDIVCCCSSSGEGFSNAIGEAMACGVPCVVTDVGDAAHIVGDTGCVTAPGDHRALAAAIGRLADLPSAERRALGCAGRERVVSEFGMESLAQRTERALDLA